MLASMLTRQAGKADVSPANSRCADVRSEMCPIVARVKHTRAVRSKPKTLYAMRESAR